VGVLVAVLVGVCVDVLVGVFVGVCVGVFVAGGVGVTDAATTTTGLPAPTKPGGSDGSAEAFAEIGTSTMNETSRAKLAPRAKVCLTQEVFTYLSPR